MLKKETMKVVEKETMKMVEKMPTKMIKIEVVFVEWLVVAHNAFLN